MTGKSDCFTLCACVSSSVQFLPMHVRVHVSYLLREADHGPVVRLAHQRLQEVLAAGGQHGPVAAELAALHQDGHIAQDVLLPLVVEAQEDVAAVHRRLIHVHGRFRLLIDGHSARALHRNTGQNRAGEGGVGWLAGGGRSGG